MKYNYIESDLSAYIKKEISRFAASSYSEDGSSLYDAYKILSRDEDTINSHIRDSVNSICVRFFDVASMKENGIVFNIPDFDYSMAASTCKQLDLFIVMNSCALWLEGKRAQEYQMYEKKAVSALDNAHILIKSRKAPERV
jgi:hypothetical protein